MPATLKKRSTNEDIRNERIAVQVTKEEKKQVEDEARRKGLNMSAYVRLVLSEYLAKKQ